ncbi:MAG: DUF86 domain-containing protein [Cyanobacteria bacterium P01_A01_bin.15]
MSRDNASLLDIYRAGQQAVSYVEGLDRRELETDGMRVSAILYQVLIIGEATKRLSQELRDEHPEIPWNNMAVMRDIVAHHYDEIDFGVLWSVLQLGIPDMLRKIQPLLPTEPVQ